MAIHMKHAVFLLCGLVVATQLQTPSFGQDSQADLNKILTQWRQKQSEARAVRYCATAEVFIPRGRWTGDPELPKSETGDMPPEDHFHQERLAWTVDLERNRVRTEWRYKVFLVPEARFIPAFDVRLCDRGALKKYTPRVENTSDDYTPSKHQPDVWTESQDHTVFFQAFEFPVLFAHGVVFFGSPDPRHLRKPIQASEYRVHGRGIHKGCECVIIRSVSKNPTSYQEFWVDGQRNGAILRWLYVSKSRPRLSTDVDYQPFEGGWRPDRWVTTIYDTNKGTVDAAHTLHVTDFSWNPQLDDTEFDVALVPHMVVHDAKKSKIYRVEKDLTMTELPWVAPGAEKDRGLGFWVSIVGLSILGCAVLYVSWRFITSRGRSTTTSR